MLLYYLCVAMQCCQGPFLVAMQYCQGPKDLSLLLCSVVKDPTTKKLSVASHVYKVQAKVSRVQVD